MTSRKQPSAAFWATVVVVVALVAYPLSFGPACWINSRIGRGDQLVANAYQPILSVAWRGPRAVRQICEWYAFLFSEGEWSLCRQDGKIVALPEPPRIEVPWPDGVIRRSVRAVGKRIP